MDFQHGLGSLVFRPEESNSRIQFSTHVPRYSSKEFTSWPMKQNAVVVGSETASIGRDFTARVSDTTAVSQDVNGASSFDREASNRAINEFHRKLFAKSSMLSWLQAPFSLQTANVNNEMEHLFALKGVPFYYNSFHVGIGLENYSIHPPVKTEHSYNMSLGSPCTATDTAALRPFQVTQVSVPGHGASLAAPAAQTHQIIASKDLYPKTQYRRTETGTVLDMNYPTLQWGLSQGSRSTVPSTGHFGQGSSANVAMSAPISSSSKDSTPLKYHLPTPQHVAQTMQAQPTPHVQCSISNLHLTQKLSQFQRTPYSSMTTQIGPSAPEALHRVSVNVLQVPESMDRDQTHQRNLAQSTTYEYQSHDVGANHADHGEHGSWTAQPSPFNFIELHAASKAKNPSPFLPVNPQEQINRGKRKYPSEPGVILDPIWSRRRFAWEFSTTASPSTSWTFNQDKNSAPTELNNRRDRDTTATTALHDCHWGSHCGHLIKCESRSDILDHLRQFHSPLQTITVEGSKTKRKAKKRKVKCLWRGCDRVIKDVANHIGTVHTTGFATTCPSCLRKFSRKDLFANHWKKRMETGKCPQKGRQNSGFNSSEMGRPTKKVRI